MTFLRHRTRIGETYLLVLFEDVVFRRPDVALFVDYDSARPCSPYPGGLKVRPLRRDYSTRLNATPCNRRPSSRLPSTFWVISSTVCTWHCKTCKIFTRINESIKLKIKLRLVPDSLVVVKFRAFASKEKRKLRYNLVVRISIGTFCRFYVTLETKLELTF